LVSIRPNCPIRPIYSIKARCINVFSKGNNCRLNLWVSNPAYFSLERLAKHYGVTKKMFLEKLLLQEDEKIRTSLDAGKINQYLNSKK
jgi:hypothetical protein